MKVGFVGIGKLGKPVATVMVLKGHDVMCYDVNPNNMNKEFTEIEADDKGNPNGFKNMLAKADLKFGSLQEVITHAELLFVAVQTPHHPKYEGAEKVPDEPKDFDYTYLIDCMKQINTCKIDSPKAIAIISTVLPTTVRTKVLPEVTNPNIKIIYNPHFIAMSTVVPDFLNPEFVLIGRYDAWAEKVLVDFYNTIYNNKIPFAIMSLEEAELVKVSYNFYISTKINYANFLMEICHKLSNTNVDTITNTLAMATKRIVSSKYMSGGMADQGGCHIRDCAAMRALCKRLNMTCDYSNTVLQIREKQTGWLGKLIAEQKEKTGLPIIILGRAFKENMRLINGSCALLLQQILREDFGLESTSYDPLIDIDALTMIPAIYFVATKHDIFKTYKFSNGSVVLDPFRYLKLNQEGVTYIPIGIGN